MKTNLKIAIDVMGSDNGPEAIISGASLSKERHPKIEYVFFGEHAFYEKNGKRLNNIDIEILGDDRSMHEVANNEYKGKYLSILGPLDKQLYYYHL